MSPFEKIADRLPNEHVVEVSPPPENRQGLGRRRLNFFEGRRLSHQNLALEQDHRSRHLALLGQQLSAGVVSGLEVSFIEQTGLENVLEQRLTMADGSGLTCDGEEVRLPATREVVIGNLSVYAPPEVLEPPPAPEEEDSEEEDSEEEDSEEEDTEETPAESALRPRKLGSSLQSLVSQGINLPRAGILLLESVLINSAIAQPSDDPCPIDIEGLAFANLQKIDGVRLAFYAWPEEWLALPSPAADSADTAAVNRWRSNLAYSIFRRELGEPMPWEAFGVPVALLGFDADWKLLFSDRHAVVRHGGRSLHRALPVPNSGNPFLWQARIEQFAEQLFELDRSQIPVETLSDYFAWLPPAGGLPPEIVENLALPPGGSMSDRIQRFFPTGYLIEAAPIPKDQLDLIFRESASLQPYDTVSNDASSQVKLLVPVEEEYYDADLLKLEEIDPEFNTTLMRFINDRAAVLHRRQLVRDRETLLAESITGKLSVYPNPDSDQLESNEKSVPDAPFSAQGAHQSEISRGLHEHGFSVSAAIDTLGVQAGDRLLTYVYLDPDNLPTEIMLTFQLGTDSQHSAYWGAVSSRIERGTPSTDSRRRLGELPAAGEWTRLEIPIEQVGISPGNTLSGMIFSLFNGRAAWGNTARLAGNGEEEIWFETALPESATVLTTGEPWYWLNAAERLTPFEERYGIEYDLDEPDAEASVGQIESLKNALQVNSPIDLDVVRISSPTIDADKNGLAVLLNTVPTESPIETNAAARSLTIRGVLSTEERDRLLAHADSAPSNISALVRDGFKLAVNDLFTQSQDNVLLESMSEQGLERFIRELEQRSSEANDTVEFGFLQVRTDMFRVRQLVLGEEEASRLSVSPTLSAIARQSTAAGAQQELSTFFKEIQTTAEPIAPEDIRIQPPVDFSGSGIFRRAVATSFSEGISEAIISEATDATETTPASESVPFPSVSGADARLPRSGSPASPFSLSFQPAVFTESGSSAADRFIPLTPGRLPAVDTVSPARRPIFIADRLANRTTNDLQLSQTVSLQDSRQLKAKSTAAEKVFFQAPSKAVIQQSPIVGKVNQSITVAERLKEPPAPETRNYTLAGRVSVFSGLANNSLFKDLSLPGKFSATFGQLKQRPGDFNAEPDDLSEAPDEAEYFSSSVRILDDTVAALRLAERRLADYSDAIAQAKTTLQELQTLRQQANERLSAISADLAVTRHDVAVTRSLIAEEQQRIAAINQTRRSILENHVDFLFYHRPRTLGPDINAPVRDLLPGVQFPDRPACLNRYVRIPEALKSATELLRQSPVNWFPQVKASTKQINRREPLLEAITKATAKAKRNATISNNIETQQFSKQQFARQNTPYATAISRVVNAQQAVANKYQINRAQINPNAFAELNWLYLQENANQLLTLGDIIDSPNSNLSQQAAKELTDITNALGCLYHRFGQVRPVIRLAWAERLSQFDDPVDLRNFSDLSRWGEIEYLARRELQSIADWLYRRLSNNFSEAIALLNDLVRICILLASAAPVAQIIAGQIETPTAVGKGGSVSIAVNPNLVGVGMQVFLFDQSNSAIAEGIVEDLVDNRAAARITSAKASTVQLAASTQVRFQHIESLSAELQPFDLSEVGFKAVSFQQGGLR